MRREDKNLFLWTRALSLIQKDWDEEMLSLDLISSAHTLTSYSHMQRVCVLAYVVWTKKKIRLRIVQTANKYFVTLSEANWSRDGHANSLSGSSICHVSLTSCLVVCRLPVGREISGWCSFSMLWEKLKYIYSKLY